MWRTIAAVLATAVGALTLASAGAAATVTIQIRSTGFSPGAVTINHDDKITWHNADKVNHQVVSDDGSFASSPGRRRSPPRARSATTMRCSRS